MKAWLMLDAGVREHWASGGRSSRNPARGEPRPRRMAGARRRTSRQGPGPGQAAAARGAGGWGIPTRCVSSGQASLEDDWEGEDKDHLAKQNCISIISSYFFWGGGRGRGVRKLKPREGIAGTQTWTPGSHSSAFSAPFDSIPQDQELRGRGSVVTGGKRPDPPLISLIFSVHLTRVW